jgi:hypothetical protein
MNEMKQEMHTPGILSIEDGDYNYAIALRPHREDGGRTGWLLAYVPRKLDKDEPNMYEARGGSPEANARRLTACWNACLDLLDTEISQGVVPLHRFSYVVNERNEVQQQNADLLEALKAIIDSGEIPYAQSSPLVVSARALLTKCGVKVND